MQSQGPSSSTPQHNSIEMKRKTKGGKHYSHLEDKDAPDSTNKGEERIEDTRWHEGHRNGEHCEHEQHFHHLTFPSSLGDIETDDAEFVDPTENIARPTKYVLSNFEQLPKFLADNEFVRRGYRVHFSFKLCLVSLFKLHNETLNVWTHLVGTLMFFVLMIATFVKILPSIAHKRSPIPTDYAVFAVFFFGAHAQMLFSSIYHLFSAHSASVAKWLARLDYMGICLMIVGSYYPPLYYMLRSCHPDLMRIHLSAISLLGVLGLIIVTLPKLQGPRFRVFRAIFFVIFGLYIVIPMPHIIYLMGFAFIWPILWRLSVMGLLYIFGAGFYASRCPERCCPGKFDFGWYSHPIWHLFVIAAGLMQFYNCIYAYTQFPLVMDCPT